MATLLNNLDNILTASATKGPLPIFWFDYLGVATTAATTTSGYVTGQRFNRSISFASPFVAGSGITGANLTYARMAGVSLGVSMMVGIEYLMGTLTVNGNSYVDGVAMPTKTIKGTSVQTASGYLLAVVTTTLVATTPVLTINYTNQSGTTGHSCTLTLPTNSAVSTAFLINPHLQSGDSGAQNLSASGPNGLSISTGTGGVIKVYGVLPLSECAVGSAATPITPDPLSVSQENYLWESGEALGFYRFGASAINGHMFAHLNFVPSD